VPEIYIIKFRNEQIYFTDTNTKVGTTITVLATVRLPISLNSSANFYNCKSSNIKINKLFANALGLVAIAQLCNIKCGFNSYTG